MQLTRVLIVHGSSMMNWDRWLRMIHIEIVYAKLGSVSLNDVIKITIPAIFRI